MNIIPYKYLNIKLKVFLILFILHILTCILIIYFPQYINELSILNFDYETNIPTLFSSVNLLISSLLCYKIYSALSNKSWLIVSIAFIFASIDETARIHERLSLFVFVNTNIPFSWPYIYFSFIVVFFLIFKNFFVIFKKNTKKIIIMSFILFISGSLGFELISFLNSDDFNPANPLKSKIILSTIEESLEIIGVIIFNFGLLKYLREELKVRHL